MDHLDEQIVASLVKDGRASLHGIGREIGLSAPAVKRRVDRLITDGVIEGFTAVVNQEALGHPLEAFVELHCEGKIAPSRIREMVAGIDEVKAAYTVTGEADAFIHVYADDMRHFEQTLERIREQPGIKQTRSTVVLSRL